MAKPKFDSLKYFQARVARFEIECARIKRGDRGCEDVVFLGDSLAEGSRNLLGWVNRGVSSDHLSWPTSNVFQRLGSDRLHPRPKTIVILIGINDLLDDANATGRHIEAYRCLLVNLRQLYPTAELVAVSLFPTGGPLAHLNEPIIRFNGELAELAATTGARYWDVHSTLYDAERKVARRGWLQRDGIHLLRVAYLPLAAILRRHAAGLTPKEPWGEPMPDALRRRLGHAILDTFGLECWAGLGGADTAEGAIEYHVLSEIDYLLKYVRTEAPVFRDLYLGSRARFIARNPRLWQDEPNGIKAILDRDRAVWLETVGHGDGRLRGALELAFREFDGKSAAPRPKSVRLLFIGDCLLEDVELLAGGKLLPMGLLLEGDFVVTRNPVEQTRQINERVGQKYDGIVYSPLSWQFDQEFQSVLEVRGSSSVDDLENIWRRVAGRIKQLAQAFDCNLYVHNTSAVVRASNDFNRALKSLATYHKRNPARRTVARRIQDLVEDINQASFRHVFTIDELASVHGWRDDFSLGRLLYYTGAVHPAELSVVAADQLHDYVVVQKLFIEKKVVVCDLDNTLWDGVIGEGDGVRHQELRQRILLDLKRRGVVLAINSKNDPDKVRWNGGVLSSTDFVAQEISWSPKSVGMKRIADTLNLKVKDFVFIDDRPDERAMIKEDFPQLTALDPCAEQTWTLFKTWARMAEEGGDRTAMYHERSEREKLLTSVESERDTIEMFSRLELKLDLRRSTQDDLKRVHELINRTNQWNLKGSRCAFNEVQAWHDSKDHLIYTARVSDKFGDMGIICCCVARQDADALSVLVFVLSCRVFGYGVETSLIERLKRDAMERFGAPKVRGYLVQTEHNKPCRSMYADHGFSEQGDAWLYTGGPIKVPMPVWFDSLSAAS